MECRILHSSDILGLKSAMKKMLIIIIVLLLATASGCSKEIIDENSGPVKDKFDAYVYGYFGHSMGFSFENLETVSIGEGIPVKGEKPYEMFVYPIYENDELSGFFEVTYQDGVWGGAYPSNIGNDVKRLWDINLEEFVIFVYRARFYGYAGNKVFDYRTGEIIKAKNFQGELPNKIKYDQSKRVSVRIPNVRGTVTFSDMTYNIELTSEDATSFLMIYLETRKDKYPDGYFETKGIAPVYTVNIIDGDDEYVLNGFESEGGQYIVSDGLWITDLRNPIFYTAQKMKTNYKQDIYEALSDRVYEKIRSNGLKMLIYPFSATGNYEGDYSEIDYGVYVAPDTMPMNDIFTELGIDEESNMTLSEYYEAYFTGERAEPWRRPIYEKYSISIAGSGKKGTYYYIASKDEKYNTMSGFIVHGQKE